jgi:hypothetical protein
MPGVGLVSIGGEQNPAIRVQVTLFPRGSGRHTSLREDTGRFLHNPLRESDPDHIEVAASLVWLML